MGRYTAHLSSNAEHRAVIAEITAATRVKLAPEPDSQHDPHAIMAVTVDGKKLGNVERDSLLVKAIFAPAANQRQRRGRGANFAKSVAHLVLGAFAFASPAKSADTCSATVGMVLHPMTFDQVFSQLAALPRFKGEFETTVAYQARVATMQKSLPTEFYVRIPIDRKYVSYDADSHIIRIERFAIQNKNTGYEAVFGWRASKNMQMDYAPIGNVDIVLSSIDRRIGGYIGSNAFGVGVHVDRIDRLTRSIFIRSPHGLDDNIFFRPMPGEISNDRPIIEIAADSSQARSLKAGLRAVVIFRPKAPFTATGIDHWEPEIDSPYDVRETHHVVVADVSCIVVTDSTDRVLATRNTE